MTQRLPRLSRLGLLIFVVPVMVALIVQGAIKGAKRVDLDYRSLQFAYALSIIRTYEESENRVPPAVLRGRQGEEIGSWRMASVRYFAEPPAFPDLTSSWKSPTNQGLAGLSLEPFCFQHPSHTPSTETNIFAVTGPNTAFDTRRSSRLSELPQDLILLIEVGKSGVHWMAPGDFDVRHLPQSVGKGSDGKGVFVGFNDQQVWYIGADVPAELLARFGTIDGAIKWDRDTVLGPYRLFSRE